MTLIATTALWFALSAAESLGALQYRAVTIEPAQRLTFRVHELERVTAASGRCVEEGMDLEEPETFWLQASCSGVRTSFAWKKDGTRVHVMACAEDGKRTPELVKLRQKVQADLKAYKAVTACVRSGQVQLWGWALSPAERDKVAAIAKKHGEAVENRVELIGEDEQ